MIYSDGAKRRRDGAAAAWVGRRFSSDNAASKLRSTVVFAQGIKIEDHMTTAFGAELIALEGAVMQAITTLV